MRAINAYNPTNPDARDLDTATTVRRDERTSAGQEYPRCRSLPGQVIPIAGMATHHVPGRLVELNRVRRWGARRLSQLLAV